MDAFLLFIIRSLVEIAIHIEKTFHCIVTCIVIFTCIVTQLLSLHIFDFETLRGRELWAHESFSASNVSVKSVCNARIHEM